MVMLGRQHIKNLALVTLLVMRLFTLPLILSVITLLRLTLLILLALSTLTTGLRKA